MENNKLEKETDPEVTKWFKQLDTFNSVPFSFKRQQPTTPKRKIFDDADRECTQS